MRNLWRFISNYNAFFLFLIFEVASLIIFVKNNSYQRAEFVNSANGVAGKVYEQIDKLYSYLSLNDVNDSLARENAHLRSLLKTSYYVDTVTRHQASDTVYKQQYEYIMARVINNSVNKSANYLTINKGSKQGLVKGMGVICSKGIVGKIIFVSDHFALVQSLLHKDSQFSAMLAGSKDIGSVVWGDEMDPGKAVLKDVSNNAQPKLGEWVVTSGYSLFPEGIPIGKISNLHTRNGGYSLNMELTLSVDFSKLEYVDVVYNKFGPEQDGLEARQKKDE
jgi:rod shape-determining protein MreC